MSCVICFFIMTGDCCIQLHLAGSYENNGFCLLITYYHPLFIYFSLEFVSLTHFPNICVFPGIDRFCFRSSCFYEH